MSGTVKVEVDNGEYCEYLKNLGAHEFGHILGLDDETTAAGKPRNVMDPADIPVDDPVPFSPADDQEWSKLYATVSSASPQGLVQYSVTESPPGQYLYTYEVEWLDGPELPVFVLDVNCEPAAVIPFTMPPDWILDYPVTYQDVMPNPALTPQDRLLYFECEYAGLGPEAGPLGTFVLASPHPPGPGTADIMADMDGDGVYDPVPVPVPTDPTVAVPDRPGGPTVGLRLLAPGPNPFRDRVEVRFRAGRAFPSGRVLFYDPAGRLLRALDLGPVAAGPGRAAWDGRDASGRQVPAGIVFYRVELGSEVRSGRLLRIP